MRFSAPGSAKEPGEAALLDGPAQALFPETVHRFGGSAGLEKAGSELAIVELLAGVLLHEPGQLTFETAPLTKCTPSTSVLPKSPANRTRGTGTSDATRAEGPFAGALPFR